MILLGFRPLVVEPGTPAKVQFFTGVEDYPQTVCMPVSVAGDMVGMLRPLVMKGDVGGIRSYFRNFNLPQRCWGSLLCTLFLADSMNLAERLQKTELTPQDFTELATTLSPDQSFPQGIAQYFKPDEGRLVLPGDTSQLRLTHLQIKSANPYAGEDMRQYFSSGRPPSVDPQRAALQTIFKQYEESMTPEISEDFSDRVMNAIIAARAVTNPLELQGYDPEYAEEIAERTRSQQRKSPPETLWRKFLSILGIKK